MITQINHIGIAVNSLEERIPFYRDVLRLKMIGTEEVPDQKVRVAFFEVGEVHIELLEPINGEGPIAKFIEKRGAGIHHMCYRVSNVQSKMDELIAKGYKFLYEEPRKGANNCLVNFMHPKSGGGVLIELSQKMED